MWTHNLTSCYFQSVRSTTVLQPPTNFNLMQTRWPKPKASQDKVTFNSDFLERQFCRRQDSNPRLAYFMQQVSPESDLNKKSHPTSALETWSLLIRLGALRRLRSLCAAGTGSGSWRRRLSRRLPWPRWCGGTWCCCRRQEWGHLRKENILILSSRLALAETIWATSRMMTLIGY